MLIELLTEMTQEGTLPEKETVMQEIKSMIDPNHFDTEMKSLAAQTTIILAKQIVDGYLENPETFQEDLCDLYSLGYLTGFILQALNWSEIKGAEERAESIELSNQLIFGKTASNVSQKIFAQLVAQEKIFIKGIEIGGLDAQNLLESHEEPLALKNYLINKN